ncbi:ABC transporter permease [Paenibacillaceae bacterium WGS1546]|uniref:ABC transporter permease n=1 Tax=Cohnella sp. WGS1546 TaxID=3366810 RepID=UPI00372D70A2
MYRMLLHKLLQAVVTLFIATLIIFLLIRLAPGDPVKVLLSRTGEIAMSDSQAYDRKLAELRAQHGLDQNMAAQYAAWAQNLLRLDLGASIHTGRQVQSEIAARLPATFMLAAAALLAQIALGLLFGIVSALRAGKAWDNAVRLACVALASTPAFVLGLVLLSMFAVTLGIYEISSEATLARLWLPALTLGLIGAPQLIRVVRANLLSELGQTYVSAALARGLNRKLVVRHAFRNALVPVSTMVGLSFAGLVSGAVVIESIFSWPGVGKYALDSILLKDYPAIQGYALVMVALVIFINLFVDALYAMIDPRLRRKEAAGGGSYA